MGREADGGNREVGVVLCGFGFRGEGRSVNDATSCDIM